MKQLVQIVLFVLALFCQNVYSVSNDAPDFNLPGIKGNVQLTELKGKVIYLDFWASWCKPCKKSFPWMNEMQQRYADDGFEVLAVNLDKDRKLADEFLKQVNTRFTVVFDENGTTASLYKLKGMPSSYLITRDGKVSASHVGFREKDKEKLEQAIKKLLGK
jgi:cytochrome c biogenesis protein CcmG/thiol:disulfide interchange protein DsbE